MKPRNKIIKLLVTDDHEDILELIDDILEGDAEVDLKTSSSGKNTLEILKGEKFGLILIDYFMPDMNGVEVIKAIRGGPGPNMDTPFVIFSGFVEEAQSLLKGVDKVVYIDKPVDINHFKYAVKSAFSIKF